MEALPLEVLSDGARLWAEDDRLRFRDADMVTTPALREELLRRKPEIAARLGRRARYELPSLSQRLWFFDHRDPPAHSATDRAVASALPQVGQVQGEPVQVTI